MPQLLKSPALVLRSIKYSETSIVTHLLTREAGLKNYIVSGLRSTKKKKGFHSAQFQAGTLLEIVAYDNPKKDLNRLKEVQAQPALHSIAKTFPALMVLHFACEVVYYSMREHEPLPQAFDQLQGLILELNAGNLPAFQFPLYFLFAWAGHLGIRPETAEEMANELIGAKIQVKPDEEDWLHAQFAGNTLDKEARKRLVELWIWWFRIQIENFPELKTMKIIAQLNKKT